LGIGWAQGERPNLEWLLIEQEFQFGLFCFVLKFSDAGENSALRGSSGLARKSSETMPSYSADADFMVDDGEILVFELAESRTAPSLKRWTSASADCG